MGRTLCSAGGGDSQNRRVLESDPPDTRKSDSIPTLDEIWGSNGHE